MKQIIQNEIDKLKQEFVNISTYIGENPELGHEEFKSSAILIETLEQHGFNVEKGTCGLPTAFRAVYDSGIAGAAIGLMAEYDALPEVGHACGHNLIGTMAIAAGIGLSKAVGETGGKVIVYGTPAEETKGGKVTMAENGIFDELDVAMMVHPLSKYLKSGRSLAMDAIQFEFFGKSAHAAASPEKGINALDAVLQTFNSINALRQHITSDARIHGIIPEGGKAANVVPDYASAQFYVRASSRSYVNELVEKVKACAQGAALQTGAEMKASFYEFSYDDMQTNQQLSDAFTNELIGLGIDPGEIHEDRDGSGSLDMGNVSQAVPSIHPYIKICDEDFACHTHEFREAAMSSQAQEAMILGAKAMALTGYEILSSEELLQSIREEFKKNKLVNA
ncbi:MULTISPECIES: M20 family metallopeptidase [Bacillaceae]|uniref:Peptidase M20 domain-containing protein 2 n=1 Tax=Bacillus infantis TaxID=324767 RepID=A0A5D4SPR1_9BACI|nr:M20 family metallopeptidase [Bacillus infantis]MCA1036923.1 M20 family metallopeptidase [Bacillus infantis]MCK6207018.1 M20 family metallopeptidase [Bacillus infantis]MDW2878365.1 M20 family metallopeptidase [Bacillus infantis]TYS65290.1 M20 family metallopeptidase [Bacillus infantis]